MPDLAQRYRAIVGETLRMEREEAERQGDDLSSTPKPRLYAYLHTKDTAKGIALMPLALQTAAAQDNVSTYHNAACIFVRAKKFDEALDCVKLAKAGGYEDFARMQVDEDLAPLAKKKAFQDLFVALPKGGKKTTGSKTKSPAKKKN